MNEQTPPSPQPQPDGGGAHNPSQQQGSGRRKRRRRRRGKGNQGVPGQHQHPHHPPHPPQQQQQRPQGENTGSPNGQGQPTQQQAHRQQPQQPQKHYQVQIAGFDPHTAPRIKPFEDLTSIDPRPRLTLEYRGCPDDCRLIDLFCPIGRGQRALIVSPPKAGKTTLLKNISTAIVHNHRDVTVIALLIDERPEEVTDFRRSFAAFGNHDDGTPPRRCSPAATTTRSSSTRRWRSARWRSPSAWWKRASTW
ncbi:MAG: hypothetical protein QM783_00790 [Phycisphaerales bacterium]